MTDESVALPRHEDFKQLHADDFVQTATAIGKAFWDTIRNQNVVPRALRMRLRKEDWDRAKDVVILQMALIRGDRKSILCLFDVDGTLTPPTLVIEDEMQGFMAELRNSVSVGLVGGSDYAKLQRQLRNEDVTQLYDYVFPENGLVAYKDGKLLSVRNIKEQVSEGNLKNVINFCLRYIADLDLPIKRGTFIEFRNGVINICPMGRNCSQDERVVFIEYDKVHRVRQKFMEKLQKEFEDWQFCIGGQISFEVFPRGWDKTFCLNHVMNEGFKEIHFFGDKCFKGGNDYDLFMDERTIGHEVSSPEDTINQVKELFFS